LRQSATGSQTPLLHVAVSRQRHVPTTCRSQHKSKSIANSASAGTAIAPFLPVPPPPVGIIWQPLYFFLFCVRAPFFVAFSLLYFCILEWISVGRRLKYGVLWLMLGIPGVWWVDLQVDGVKRGYVKLFTTIGIWRLNATNHC
jgi:hypothetical protein